MEAYAPKEIRKTYKGHAEKDEGLQQSFREILSSKEGVVKYVFRGMHRTVIYKKPTFSGLWYGPGIIENF